MRVLMAGVDESTRGGMWTVVENYLQDGDFVSETNLTYIPTAVTGCGALRKLGFTARGLFRVRKALRRQSPDIVHVHMSERASILRKHLVLAMAKKQGAKTVLHMHGAEFEVLYRQMKPRQQVFVRQTLNLADRVLILGEYWRDFVGSLLADPEKLRVVYNAVPVPPECRYDPDARELLFLGAVGPRKGVYVLLEAMKQCPGLRLRLYGPDTEGDIEARIQAAGLADRVRYCGWLDADGKDAVLRSTAVNVLPSFNEGLPMTILEAMAYGIPSVTTTVAAIPEAVKDTNGILVPPGDPEALAAALNRIMADNSYRRNLSHQAWLDAVRRFSIGTHIRQIEAIYQELV